MQKQIRIAIVYSFISFFIFLIINNYGINKYFALLQKIVNIFQLIEMKCILNEKKNKNQNIFRMFMLSFFVGAIFTSKAIENLLLLLTYHSDKYLSEIHKKLEIVSLIAMSRIL